MKKISTIVFLTIILSGCTDVEGYETDISTLEDEIEELTTVLASTEKNNEELNKSIEKTSKDKDKIQNDYNNYKKRMQPYEELEESEAEARKIEADARKAEADKKAAEERAAEEKQKKEQAAAEKAEKEAAEKAAEKAKEEEIAKGYETGITHDQLARNPDDYIGEKIKFKGKVVQVIEGSGEVQLRFAVNDDYDQMILVMYSSDIVDQRVLDDDYLTIYGYSLGTISYESTMGATITIPSAYVEQIDFK